MYASDLAAPRRNRRTLLVPATAISLWIFTYLLLSVRAEMLRGDGFELLSIKRLVATLIGGLLLGLVLAASSGRSLSTSQRLAIVGTVFPASAAVFAVRVMLDYFYYGQPLTLADDVRWVLVWAGYFGLWVSAALALSLGRATAVARRPVVPAAAASRLDGSARPAPASSDATPEAWDWLADLLVEELADAPRQGRADLAARLLARAGYDIADELDPDHRRRSDRLALARSLAARLQR